MSVELTEGSLLVVRGATQHHWVHWVPKAARASPERLNLMFRVMRPHLSPYPVARKGST